MKKEKIFDKLNSMFSGIGMNLLLFIYCIGVPALLFMGMMFLDKISAPKGISLVAIWSTVCSAGPSLIFFFIALAFVKCIGYIEIEYKKYLDVIFVNKYENRSKLEDIEFEIQQSRRAHKAINELSSKTITPLSILCSAILIPIGLDYIKEKNVDKELLIETVKIIIRDGGLLVVAAFVLIVLMVIFIEYYVSATFETKIFCLEKRKKMLESYESCIKKVSQNEMPEPLG
ncbi:hypothetical protein SAMN05216390_101485 [Lachnospiraceae bacterium KH1T2]|nr:hypothetical protein SAMN05216390_101485 [Lachnospiraceae bacterium KH1T2]